MKIITKIIFNFIKFLLRGAQRSLITLQNPGIQLDKTCRFRGWPRLAIHKEAKVTICKDAVVNSKPHGYHAGMSFPVTIIADRPGAEIFIGAGSRLHGCCLHAWKHITLGKNCLIASGAQLIDANGHTSDLKLARFRDRIADEPNSILIGDYCWIALNSIILKGVTLGEGCIVAANSVVYAGNYPPFSVLIGNPATVVKTVLEEEILPETFSLENLIQEKRQSRIQY